MDDSPQIMNQIRQMNLCLLQSHLAAFDPAHIQHIIDKRKQMLAGYGDLAKIVLYQIFLVDMGRCQCRESHDSIHGSPDIMGHVI